MNVNTFTGEINGINGIGIKFGGHGRTYNTGQHYRNYYQVIACHLEKQENSYLGGASSVGSQKDYSQETAREIDLAVRELIEESYEQAKALLSRHGDDLKRGATLLLERETITPDEFPPLQSLSERMQNATE